MTDYPRVISVRVAGQPVPGIVAKPGSPAVLDGYHIVFVVCSQSCVSALQAAVARERAPLVIH